VYLSSIVILAGSGAFLIINPTPSPEYHQNLKMIEHAIWAFLCIMNLEIIRKIYESIKDATISRGFIAFGVVFICILLWKGSELSCRFTSGTRIGKNHRRYD